MQKLEVTLDSRVEEALSLSVCGPLLASPDQAPPLEAVLPRETWADVRLPPTGQSSDAHVESAVMLAREAFAQGQWRGLAKRERRAILLRWADRLSEHAERLACLNCLETGRSLSSLRRDSLPKAIQALRWFSELTDKMEDRSVHSGEFGGDFALMRREPIGVVAAILPWNDPLVTLLWKVAPALAMGNSVIVKPSEHATLVIREALLLASQAGIPAGALQMLTGDGRVGEKLVCQALVDKIAFTGSSRTAAAIGAQAHRHGLKRLSFECGGKGAFIYGLGGRNPEEFARVVAQNMFYNQGQICSAPSVVHVPASLEDEIASHLCQASLAYRPGHPQRGDGVGFMVSRDAVKRVRGVLSTLEDECFVGASNDRFSPPEYPEWSIAPTVLRGVADGHPSWDTELFGPVVLIRPYGVVADAVAHANASQYGLAHGIWSQDIDECMAVADALQAGNVHINSWGDDPLQVPFGGVKASGHGKEKSLDTLESYSHVKSIFFRPGSKR